MAAFMDMTPEEKEEFDTWLAERPPVIQEMVKTHPPDRLYYNKASHHRMCIVSYSEDGTVTALVSGKYNFCIFERNVFGIPLSDLEECDLPAEGALLGTVLTEQEEIDKFIEISRPHVLKAREQCQEN